MSDFEQAPAVDVVVIGAGFAGLYALYRLREAGLVVRVFERGDGVAARGTGTATRAPGSTSSRSSTCSPSSPTSSRSGTGPSSCRPKPRSSATSTGSPTKLELGDGITFNAAVQRATYDDVTAIWQVETATGEQVVARFLVAATGCLSAPIEPAIPGLAAFRGDSLYTNRFPQDGYDFTAKRVAVIGTGSSGVHSIPVIAKQAAELFVLQRSAAYTLPSPNRPLGPNELDELKSQYADIRSAQWASPVGTARFGAVSFLGRRSLKNILEVHPSCNSWYLGANVPGKTRHYMPYAGGLTRYMARCADVVATGYTGFELV